MHYRFPQHKSIESLLDDSAVNSSRNKVIPMNQMSSQQSPVNNHTNSSNGGHYSSSGAVSTNPYEG